MYKSRFHNRMQTVQTLKLKMIEARLGLKKGKKKHLNIEKKKKYTIL